MHISSFPIVKQYIIIIFVSDAYEVVRYWHNERNNHQPEASVMGQWVKIACSTHSSRTQAIFIFNR